MTEYRDSEIVAWIKRKLELPETATASDVFGRMHVLASNSHGYLTYIEAFKCNDKQGEIARLTVDLAEMEARWRRIVEACSVEDDTEAAWRVWECVENEIEKAGESRSGRGT